MKSYLKLVAPATEKRTVMALRRPNAAVRAREYLTEDEVMALIGFRRERSIISKPV
jgi:hypothetical protein